MRGKQIRKTVEIINFCFGIVGSLGVIGAIGKVCRFRGTSFYGANPQMAGFIVGFYFFGRGTFESKRFCFGIVGDFRLSGTI
jgi:hypothetical protein